ncbi:MAG: branched-chain amino acid transaminase [Thermoplasmata archaeon]
MEQATPKKVWMDGTLVDFAQARVHVLGHTLHYGVGVFEGIRAYPTPQGAAIFRLREHVERLIDSARFYHMPVSYGLEEIERAIVETQAANDILPSYIRPILYRGEPGLGVKNLRGKVSLAIGVIPAAKYLGDASDSGVRAKLSPFRKPHSMAVPAAAKATGNYLNSYLAGVDAQEDGYDEAILLDRGGNVAEGTGENIFLVSDRTVYTPGTESDMLMGVTRDSVLRIARDLGLSVVEKPISVNELLSADEAFFTGTYAEIAPIREVSHYRIGSAVPGPVTKEIAQVYYRAVHGEDARYRAWLTPVPKARPIARASAARA